MILYILDRTFTPVGDPIDTWTTAMWYVRYNEEGEMSLFLPASMILNEHIKNGNYLTDPALPDTYMIIESLETHSDPEEGNQLVVTGRSLESILRRRIIWNKIVVENGNLQDTIERILNENVISPSNSSRAISGFRFKRSTDARITALTVTCSLHGQNVYEVIADYCQNEQIGFKVTPVDGGGFEFSLYAGTDRSYAQDTQPWVVFSRGYENLGETTNTESTKALKNTALVYNERTVRETTTDDAGNTETTEETIITEVEVYGTGGAVSGLDRREMYLASNANNRKDDDTDMTDEEYKAVLQNEGSVELSQHEIEKVYTGVVDARRQYVLNKDFFLGDIVQFVNEYGQEGRTRVYEIIHSHDKDGDQFTPTFVNVPGDK